MIVEFRDDDGEVLSEVLSDSLNAGDHFSVSFDGVVKSADSHLTLRCKEIVADDLLTAFTSDLYLELGYFLNLFDSFRNVTCVVGREVGLQVHCSHVFLHVFEHLRRGAVLRGVVNPLLEQLLRVVEELDRAPRVLHLAVHHGKLPMHSGQLSPVLTVDALLNAKQVVPHVQRLRVALLCLRQSAHERDDLFEERVLAVAL